nr:uncharacterized protein LOC127327052 [Lolium perenne]
MAAAAHAMLDLDLVAEEKPRSGRRPRKPLPSAASRRTGLRRCPLLFVCASASMVRKGPAPPRPASSSAPRAATARTCPWSAPYPAILAATSQPPPSPRSPRPPPSRTKPMNTAWRGSTTSIVAGGPMMARDHRASSPAHTRDAVGAPPGVGRGGPGADRRQASSRVSPSVQRARAPPATVDASLRRRHARAGSRRAPSL